MKTMLDRKWQAISLKRKYSKQMRRKGMESIVKVIHNLSRCRVPLQAALK